MNFDHIFIDFDGTLINSVESMYQAYSSLLSRYGNEGSREEFNSLNGPSTSEIVEILRSRYNFTESSEEMMNFYLGLIKKNNVRPRSLRVLLRYRRSSNVNGCVALKRNNTAWHWSK